MLSERAALDCIFMNLPHYCLVSWEPLGSLTCCCRLLGVSIEVHEENPASQPRSWKSQEHFNNLFRSLWIFFFDAARQWQGHVVSFLKASCHVCPRPASAKPLSLVTLESSGSPWTSRERFCHVVPWSFGKYWFTDSCGSLNSWHVHCTVSVYSFKKATFVNVNTNLLGKVFNYWDLSFL